MAAFPKYTYLHVTAATSLPVKTGAGGAPVQGALAGVSVNKALVGTVTIKDGSNTVAILTNGTTAPLGMTLVGPIEFSNLTVSMSTAAEDVTFIYE